MADKSYNTIMSAWLDVKNMCCILLFLFIAAGDLRAQTVRKHFNVDSGWQFHLGNSIEPEKDFGYGLANIFSKAKINLPVLTDIAFSDNGNWQNISVPHDWAVALPFSYSLNSDQESHGYKTIGNSFPQNSIGWYRKLLDIPATDSGKRFQLQFDGVFRNYIVWVNGIYIGNQLSGYTGANFDITDAIDFHRKNIIVIRVDAFQYEGWFYEGAGIYRHVWLNEYENVHTSPESIYIRTEEQFKAAKIFVKTDILNEGLNEADISIEQIIIDKKSNIISRVQTKSSTVSSKNKHTFSSVMSVSNPLLWDIDQPNRYTLITRVLKGNELVDELHTRFGVRYLRFDADSGFFLNGRNIKIKGVCCHQDHAGVGSAIPDALQYYRIGLLKEMGANAYRTSHNPPTPEILEACDSLGMLVLDETRLLNSGQEYQNQFAYLIKRDRNHPSVFLWSIGNEEEAVQTTSYGKTTAQNMIALQKTLDMDRICTYAADVGNVFQGVNEVIPVRGFNYNIDEIVAYHELHPSQPIIGTEMASTVSTRGIYISQDNPINKIGKFARGNYLADTIHSYLLDEDYSYTSWASTAEKWWQLFNKYTWTMGGFVWTGFDYRGEPTPFTWPNINSHFGIMDMCGFPKNIYYYYQSWWSEKDVIHIGSHWNFQGKEGEKINVWLYGNAEQVELFLNNKSLGRKNMPKDGHLIWEVIYHPGTLKAVGYKNGKTIQTQVSTTSKPTTIALSTSKNILRADGQDAVVINVEVLDSNGLKVPDASNMIMFAIKGDARILGVGNGDPSSHEPDQCLQSAYQRKLFNGKCQIIIGAGYKRSDIEITVESEGLITKKIHLQQE